MSADAELVETGLDNAFILVAGDKKKLVTKNLTPGIQVYGEKLISVACVEYRQWDPYRSKLAAIVLKGSSLSIKKESDVLYLGAAHGTTASHVSDIVSLGEVFAIEFSPRAMQDLIRVSIPRINFIPILADASHPNSYKNMVTDVDFLYQDIAQREQAGIAIRNSVFLKKDGILILILKSRSIDSTRKTGEIISREVNKLEGIFKIRELINLEPFHSDHAAVIAQRI